MLTINVLDIDFDVDYTYQKVRNDNGVGQDSTYITIENVCLTGDTGYDLSEVLSDYVMERFEQRISEVI